MIPGTRESASGCPEVRSAGTGPSAAGAGVALSAILLCATIHSGLCDLSRLPSETLLHAILHWQCHSPVTHASPHLWGPLPARSAGRSLAVAKTQVSRLFGRDHCEAVADPPSGSRASRRLQKVSQGTRRRDFCCHRHTGLGYRVRVCTRAVTRCPVDEGFTGRLPACPSAAVQVDPKRLGRGTHRIPAAT